MTGVFVLEQKETPGLGDLITEPDFLKQFVGLSTDLELGSHHAPPDPAAGKIRALTGATISSDTVCNAINESVKAVKEPLSAAAKSAGAGG